ncbi:MAG: DUF6677 family protein [Planctomycetota bacterium]
MWNSVLATLAALTIPGGGALVRGEPRRALALLVSIGGLLVGGVLIGGVGVIDRRDERWWFMLQAPAGVTVWVVDSLVQTTWKGRSQGVLRLPVDGERVAMEPDPHTLEGERPAIVPHRPGEPLTPRASLGRSTEIGSLYIAAAGLLNLLVLVNLWSPVGSEEPGRAAGARS